jgi:DNA-binding NtrC family response regulator
VNILCVEDDPDTRLAYEHVLTEMGHTMCWAETVSGAAGLLRTEVINLVLLDVGLRGEPYGGLEVAGLVPRKIPVFIVSGHGLVDLEAHTHGELAGLFLYFEKPPNAALLSQEIARVGAMRPDPMRRSRPPFSSPPPTQ